MHFPLRTAFAACQNFDMLHFIVQFKLLISFLCYILILFISFIKETF